MLVDARLAVVGELPALPEEPRAARARARATPQPAGAVYLDVARGTGVRSRHGGAGAGGGTGPAIVEAATTTARSCARASARP